MKLNYFSAETLPKGNLGIQNIPRIGFGKNGTIRFNSSACRLIGLKSGDKVTLAQDEEQPENWYVFKDPENGFTLRLLTDKRAHGFNHSGFIALFKEAMGITDDKGYSFPIDETHKSFKGDKNQYWVILIG